MAALWWFAAVPIAIVVHEVGHVLCASIGSLPIRLISIGVGPVLLRGRVGNIRVEFRLLPFSGFVVINPSGRVGTGWQLLFVLGGVLGNAVLIAVVAWLDSVGALLKLPTFVRDGLGPLVFAQLYVIVVNLFPFQVKINGIRAASDGLQLFQLLRGVRLFADPESIYDRLLGRYSSGREVQPSQAASRIKYHVSRIERWTDENILRDVRESLLRELARGDLAREEKMLVLDCLVTDGLMQGDTTLRPQLCEWSLRALQLGPQVKTLLGSRGAVLVECGRYEAGKVLLQAAAAGNHADPFDGVMHDIFLARAEYGLGNAATAQRLIGAARIAAETTQPSPGLLSLIARIEAELGSVS